VRKLIIIISVLLFAAGCTVKYSFTVFIADFKNMAPLVNPALSNDLTEALKDKFVNQTSLKIGDENADLYFEGTITNYNTQPTAIKSDDIASKNRLTISIKVKFTNNKDPKTNFDTSFSRYQDYDSQNSLSDVEDELVRLIIEDLVDDIFTKAVVNW